VTTKIFLETILSKYQVCRKAKF